jgi:Ca-activated chloride channel family protein
MSGHRFALLLLLVPQVAAAQGWIEPDIRRPIPFPTAVIRTASSVRAVVDGRVVRFEVEERFQNRGGGLAEGVYLYPLPTDAAFSDFSLFQGDRELKGEVMTADRARQIYEEIVRRKRDPALLTLAGHGLIRAQVFPIQPGETRTVILRYTQVLPNAGDAARLRYSLGARGDSAQVAFRLRLPRSDQFGRPFSPTHPLAVRENDEGTVASIDRPAGSEIQILLPLRRSLAGGSVLTSANAGEAGHFLLLVTPPAPNDREALPRDLTLVVDVSGSMSGDKLDQAKAALSQALGTLRPIDRFRLVAFSTAVRQFREGFSTATADNLREARQFVSALEASGGTNIAGALEVALGGGDPEHLPVLVFLTDGLPSVGEQAPDRIAATAGSRIGRTRVFPVGIGHDVNTYLIERLAAEGRGAAEFIPPGANVEDVVGGLLTKLARPALTDLRIVSSPVRLEQLAPTTLPDLFHGEELVVFGRYQGSGDGPVVIEGSRNGRTVRFEIQASFPRNQPDNQFIGALWAARRIGDLTRELRLEGSTPERIQQIRDLGLRYGVITEYTSYLVQEPDVVAASRAESQQNAAPAARTGAAEFRRAKESADLSKTINLEELVVTGTAAPVERAGNLRIRGVSATAPTTADGAIRRSGNRLFINRGGIWTDALHRATLRSISVHPFSTAYFELLNALPEVVPMLIKDARQLVAGQRASLLFDPAGKSEWASGELAQLVREYRGQ